MDIATSSTTGRPALAVLSTLFPSPAQPVAGVFIKERMFRVARHLPVTVIAPQPWFPLQGWIRHLKPGYRPERPRFETMEGIDVHRPRYLALPGLLRRLDALSIACATAPLLRRLRDRGRADVLDVHFGYPEGYAGHLLARWLKLPLVVTLRGKEDRMRSDRPMRSRMAKALTHADRVVTVSSALRDVALELGAAPERSLLIGNGIDLDKFRPIERAEARRKLGIAADAEVLVSVGGLVERKGFHRVIDCLPALLQTHPKLQLLVVGSGGPEGDISDQLHRQVETLGLAANVRFLGAVAPRDLHVPLSASDVFVLATRYEGWANVLLEAMACGLPVVTTRVGGNAEVVCRPDLGTLVPFGDSDALSEALGDALTRDWRRDDILAYAADNTWDRRIESLVQMFGELRRTPAVPSGAPTNALGH